MTIKNIIDREVWLDNYCYNDSSNIYIHIFDIFDNDKKYAKIWYMRNSRRAGFFFKNKNQKRANRLHLYEYYQKDAELRYNEMIYRLIKLCRREIEIERKCKREVKIEGNFSYYFKPLYEAVSQELVETIESIYKAGEVTEDVIDAQLNRKIDKELGRFEYDEWMKIGKIVKKNFGYII